MLPHTAAFQLRKPISNMPERTGAPITLVHSFVCTSSDFEAGRLVVDQDGPGGQSGARSHQGDTRKPDASSPDIARTQSALPF